MKTIKMVFKFAVLAVLVVFLSGFTTKKVAIGDFIRKYADQTSERMYKKMPCSVVDGYTPDQLDRRIEPVEIKSIKSKEVGGATLHFVKCKITEHVKQKNEKTWSIYVRYAALVVEEDGFGEMKVDMSKSREIIAAGPDKKGMMLLLPKTVKTGEELIK